MISSESPGMLNPIPPPTALSPDLAKTAESVRSYALDSLSPHTRRAYRAQMRKFVSWCSPRNLPYNPPTPPETLALYLAEQADRQHKVSALAQAMAAIAKVHQLQRLPDPSKDPRVQEVWRGIRRRVGVAQDQKSPIYGEVLKSMVTASPNNLIGLRDRALLLIGFAGGFRRSELVSTEIRDLTFTDDGVVVLIRRSKTDQEGRGRKVGIPFGRGRMCPVRAVEDWVRAAGITEGPVFRQVTKGGKVGEERLSGRSVARIIKKAARRAGVEGVEGLAGHSLRSGLVTAAVKAGKPLHAIMDQTGHKSVEMVQKYIREAEIFKDNAADGLI